MRGPESGWQEYLVRWGPGVGAEAGGHVKMGMPGWSEEKPWCQAHFNGDTGVTIQHEVTTLARMPEGSESQCDPVLQV